MISYCHTLPIGLEQCDDGWTTASTCKKTLFIAVWLFVECGLRTNCCTIMNRPVALSRNVPRHRVYISDGQNQIEMRSNCDLSHSDDSILTFHNSIQVFVEYNLYFRFDFYCNSIQFSIRYWNDSEILSNLIQDIRNFVKKIETKTVLNWVCFSKLSLVQPI